VPQKELSKKSVINKISCPYTEKNKKDILRIENEKKSFKKKIGCCERRLCHLFHKIIFFSVAEI
jgi:hypothetical protein